MYRPIHIPSHPREVQLSATTLTTAAESGAVARDLGFMPSRQTTPPQAGTLQGWRRVLDTPQPSGPSRPIVAPSARRAAPRRSAA
jgi:hypothetical protein